MIGSVQLSNRVESEAADVGAERKRKKMFCGTITEEACNHHPQKIVNISQAWWYKQKKRNTKKSLEFVNLLLLYKQIMVSDDTIRLGCVQIQKQG